MNIGEEKGIRIGEEEGIKIGEKKGEENKSYKFVGNLLLANEGFAIKVKQEMNSK